MKGFKNIFMDDLTGTIFTVRNGKDIPIKTLPNQKKVCVNINGKGYSVLDLILSNYDFVFSNTDRIKFKINDLGYISPRSVKINSIGNLSDDDEGISIKYKCKTKAGSANARFKDKISYGAVLQVLKLSDFNCVYCSTKLNPEDWHLDHIQPKCFSGVNTLENIAASCPKCNLMKGGQDASAFIDQCKKVCINNKIFNTEEMVQFYKNKSEKRKNDFSMYSNNKAFKKEKYGA